MIKIFLFTSLFIFTACNENKEPKDALDRYIELRLSGENSKESYYDVVGGQLEEMIESMSEAEFVDFIGSVNGVKKRNLNILHSTCTGDTCHFTYVISLAHKEGKKSLYHADIKKVALIKKIETSWKLMDIVSEPKTYLKGVAPITPEDFTKKFGIKSDDVKLDEGGRALKDKTGKFKTK